MDTTPLRRCGIHVSRFGLGTMVLGKWGNTDAEACGGIIHRAIDADVNLIDTADMYGDGENETLIGRLLDSGRDEVELCTKFHHRVGGHSDPNRRGNSRHLIMRAVDTATIDAIDGIDTVIAPGVSINPADSAWPPPGLAADQRRGPR